MPHPPQESGEDLDAPDVDAPSTPVTRAEPAGRTEPATPPTEDPEAADPVPWRPRDALWVFLLWWGAQIAAGVLYLALGGDEVDEDLTLGIFTLVPQVLLLGLTALWVASRSATGIRRLIGKRRPTVRDAWAGLWHGLAALVLVNGVMALLIELLAGALGRELPQVQEGLQEVTRSPEAAPVALVGIILFAPVAEELFFRGMLQSALRRRLHAWPAIGLAAVAFALVHVEPLAVLLTFPLGLYFGRLYHRRQNIVAPVVAHLVFNASGVILIRVGLPG